MVPCTCHDTCYIAHQFQGQKVKVQGHRSTNADTQNVSYLPTTHLTSTWLPLRCDVRVEEGEYRENCLSLAVLCTIIMVHKDTSSSYRSVNCIGLWSCLVELSSEHLCVFGLHGAIYVFKK